MTELEQVEQDLNNWAKLVRDRDDLVRRALSLGMSKNRIHTITGISRSTIDRLLKESDMTTTTQLHGIGSYSNSATLTDFVAPYLGEFAGDYDVEGLVNAFRDGVNEALEGTGIVLRGDDFYSTYPAREDASDLIRAALEDVDLGPLAEKFDKTAS